MEIIVQGKGEKSFVPNFVIMNINFITKGTSYDEVLELGCNNVNLFIDNLLIKNNFNKDDLKTKNFVIKEETKYNESTRKYDFDGYSFNQRASLKFDYDKEIITKLLDSISKLDNPPYCQINFGLKDEKECRKNLLKDAYNDALNQAETIADASCKTLKQCVKVDFKPFTTNYVSQSNFDNSVMYAKNSSSFSSEIIAKTFTPEDIELNETLYCLWIAE